MIYCSIYKIALAVMKENADELYRLRECVCVYFRKYKVTCKIRNHGNAYIRMMEGEEAIKEYYGYR